MKLSVMRTAFRRAPALLALVSVVSIVAVAGCSENDMPTAPTPTPTAPAPADPPAPASPASITSVTPPAPTASDAAQLLTVAGQSFRSGLALVVTAPSGASATIQSADIRNLLPASFQAIVLLSEPGIYSLVVRQADGDVSPPFPLTVREASSPQPQLDSVSPSAIAPSPGAVVVSLAGRNFNSSLVVQVVDPDSLLIQLNQSDLLVMTASLIRFSMTFDKVGDYVVSLWDAFGPVSGPVIIRVR